MTHNLKPIARAVAVLCALAAAGRLAAPVGAQATRPEPPPRTTPVVAAPVIGSDLEDRARIDQILGRDSASGFVLRSLSTRLRAPAAGDSLVTLVFAPSLDLVVNSDLPFSQNDGAIWAGTGLSYMLRAGIVVRRGGWHLVLAPELVGVDNDSFPDVEPGRYRPIIDTERYSRYSSPWMQHPFPMDQPFRPGTDQLVELVPGQSAIWYERGGAAVGVSTESEWWGPGARNALILTNNAGGFTHAFLRTARPLRTRVGDFEGRWIVGALRESDYFDNDPDNDSRTLAAAAVTYRPRWEPELTLGVSRAVFATTSSPAKALLRWTDVFQPTARPNSRPWSDSTFTGGRDQLTSVFARWVFPRAGAEVYGELGRAEWPANLRDLLVDPTHTLAYIFGGQVARPWSRVGGVWRLQTEFAFLERSTSYRYRSTQSWYSSRAAPQGYTQRGQVLGASIGPGSSEQWLAFDVVTPAWRAGTFLGRWRLNADHNAIIPYPPGTGSCEYDVTLYPGVRGGYRTPKFGSINAEVIWANRMNYLYQNSSGCPRGGDMVDIRNRTVRLWVTPGRFR